MSFQLYSKTPLDFCVDLHLIKSDNSLQDTLTYILSVNFIIHPKGNTVFLNSSIHKGVRYLVTLRRWASKLDHWHRKGWKVSIFCVSLTGSRRVY